MKTADELEAERKLNVDLEAALRAARLTCAEAYVHLDQDRESKALKWIGRACSDIDAALAATPNQRNEELEPLVSMFCSEGHEVMHLQLQGRIWDCPVCKVEELQGRLADREQRLADSPHEPGCGAAACSHAYPKAHDPNFRVCRWTEKLHPPGIHDFTPRGPCGCAHKAWLEETG